MSMMLQRAAVLGVLVITGYSWAQNQTADPAQVNGGAIAQNPDARGLAPRVLFRKRPAADIQLPEDPSGKLIVKFADNTKTRANGGRIESAMASDISNAQRIIQQYGLTVGPAIQLEAQKLLTLESRASALTGKAQPDLAGMIELTAPGNNLRLLEQAARDLNELAEVEFVSLQPNYRTPYGGPGACCISTTNCLQTDATGCLAAGGIYLGDGTSCATPDVCSTGSTTGRCCIPANGIITCLDGVTAANCSSQGGEYGSNGSTCAGLPTGCPQLGACCLPSDQCLALIEAQCVAGQFRGVGTNCLAPGICEQVGEIGRCCVPGKGIVTCIDGIDEESCDEFGGVYGGDGSDCNDISFDCPDIGACCTGGTDCQPLTQAQCDPIPDSDFLGIGTNCADEDACEEPDCGVTGTGPCLECHSPTDYPFSNGLFCDNEDCCTAVCDIDPFCCEEDAAAFPPGRPGPPQWDSNCVSLALSLGACAGAGGDSTNVCLSTASGPCFEVHPAPGCSNGPCCSSVCTVEPFCCELNWDQVCVSLAAQLCVDAIPSNTTPSLTDAQGYLTGASYVQQFGGVPVNVTGGVPADPCDSSAQILGWTGQGWDLQAFWQFGIALAQQQGPGSVNRARGKGIKVGVIEHSAFADWQNPSFTHEDLRGKVIPEPGQTIIINPLNPFGELGGQHGTACLGIIGAKDDGMKGHSFPALGYRGGDGVLHTSNEIGVVGIAPEADLYFFPIVSLEQGGRLLSAISSALTVFGPGDVLSFSIGPGTAGETLATDPAAWTMLNLAKDLGVICCIAAGNACSNVDADAQFDGLDSGVIIVGAVTPGFPYCRLGFSNFCRACTASNVVHTAAWGAGVTTLGYGDLFFGDDSANNSGRWVRSYTSSFNGTSAATPQIAALAACMQGFAKQAYGIPLTPGQIRGIITINGYPQCLITLAEDIPGPLDDNPCVGDYDPDSDAALVSGTLNESAYPIPMLCAEAVVSSPIFDGAGNINSICILRGTHVFGNEASVRQPENNALVVHSQYTLRGDRPSAATCAEFASQIGAGNYLGNGDVFDVLLKATNPVPGANIVNVITKVGYPGVNAIQIVEFFDWPRNRWAVIGSVFMDGITNVCSANGVGVDQCIAFNAQRAGRFIRTSDNLMLCRVYVIGMGGANPDPGGFGTGAYNGRLDWVDIQTSVGGGGFVPTGGIQ